MTSLNSSEIKHDLREMQREPSSTPFAHANDTDSDSSSVNSEDVLDSEYPVQPRRTPSRRGAMGVIESLGGAYFDFFHRSEVGGLDKGNMGMGNVEHAICFVKDYMRDKHPELLEAENHREELEALRQVSRMSSSYKSLLSAYRLVTWFFYRYVVSNYVI